MPGRDRVELGVDLLLDLHLLRRRLDHEVDVAEGVVGGRALDQAHDLLEPGVGLLLRQLLLLHQPVELALGHLARLLEAVVDELLVDVLEHDGDVGRGDRLCDLAAHRAGADDRGLEDEHWVGSLRIGVRGVRAGERLAVGAPGGSAAACISASSSTSSRKRCRVRCSDFATWPRTKKRSVSQANRPPRDQLVVELQRHPGALALDLEPSSSARRSTPGRRRRSGAACAARGRAPSRSPSRARPGSSARRASRPRPGSRSPTRPRGSRRPTRASRWARSSSPRPPRARPGPGPTR